MNIGINFASPLYGFGLWNWSCASFNCMFATDKAELYSTYSPSFKL